MDAGRLPNIAVRIVPTGQDGHPGLHGAFSISYPGKSTIAYRDTADGGDIVATTARVLALEHRYERIGQIALPIGASRDLIEKAMTHGQARDGRE